MVDILIVDDNTSRPREIMSIINDLPVDVDYVTTKNDALCKLEKKEYDLAIIDIMLPENLSAIDPEKTAGVELIKDIAKRKNIHPPMSILGITSDTETYKESKIFFDENLIPILICTSADDSWKNKITEKIKYLDLVKSKKKITSVDVAIITAVEEEFNAVKECCNSWNKVNIDNDPDTYFVTDLHTNTGKTIKILLTMLPEMGMPAASNTTTKITLCFKPSKIFMVGICGGIRDDVNLCDIIIATQTWDYGCGKIMPKDDETSAYYKFSASPSQIQIQPNILDKLKYSTDDILKVITEDWNEKHPDKPVNPKLEFSPMPSGASVICDSTLFNEIIKPQHRKCKGIDMETYGVYYAVNHSSVNNVDFLSIKSVSDFADTEKNDDYHSVCCFLSSNFLIECLKNEII